MSHDDGPLDLGSVFADREPDARLEERIVADYLRASSRAHARPSPRRWIGLAAGIVLFAAGFGTGRMLSPVAETEPSTSAPRPGPVVCPGKSK